MRKLGSGEIGGLISFSGFALSLFTEYVLGIVPCLTCEVLRYSYLCLGVVFLLGRRKLSLLISVWTLAVSLWGLLGLVGIVKNPCISVCYFETERISRVLFPLSTLGAMLLTIITIRWQKASSTH